MQNRIAATFAGLEVKDMTPYNMPSEVIISASQSGLAFPGTDLVNTQDKTFAVYRMMVRIMALDSNGLLLETQPDVNVLEALIKLRTFLVGFNQEAQKANVRVSNLVQGSTSERSWVFTEPFMLPNQYGVALFADCDPFPAGFAGDVATLRVTANLQGFLLVQVPPSERR
jgi:hypothetical protein